jgi:hypothetical protein
VNVVAPATGRSKGPDTASASVATP